MKQIFYIVPRIYHTHGKVPNFVYPVFNVDVK